MIRAISGLVQVSAALVLLAIPARAAVEVQEITTPGGTEVWLVEEPSIPFVALELLFQGGTSLDAQDARGAVHLMTALIEEGAADMDARAFAVARESLAASFRFDSDDDSVTVSARFLTENRAESVALLRAALTEPRFDQDAIERVRAQVISNLRSDAQDPGRISAQNFNAMAFGDHPYGTPGKGTLDSVEGLSRDDIVAAHRGALARDRVFVAAVGDISADELAVVVDRLLADLPETGAAMPAEAEYLLSGGVTVVPFDTPQSVITFGHKGIERDDPDFFPAFVMSEILGGSGFTARLMTEVREKRGLTYGIYANLIPMDLGELLVGRVATANETVAETIDLIRAEWARMAEGGVTAEELDAAQTFLTGAYPLRFDGNARIARILVGMQSQGLPTSYLETRNASVAAVTRDDVARVATRLMDADALHFVVVGQPVGLTPGN